MINSKGVKQFCSEDISKIENYEQAVADTTQTWDCHHRLEIDENKTRARLIAEKLYWNRPASELIFLTKADHTRLHNIGKHHSEESRKKMSLSQSGEKSYWFGKRRSEESRKKMSIALKGKRRREKNPMFGKHHSEESRKKMSLSQSGEKNPAFGRKWWNNGAECVRSGECPGEGWVRGRLKRK